MDLDEDGIRISHLQSNAEFVDGRGLVLVQGEYQRIFKMPVGIESQTLASPKRGSLHFTHPRKQFRKVPDCIGIVGTFAESSFHSTLIMLQVFARLVLIAH